MTSSLDKPVATVVTLRLDEVIEPIQELINLRRHLLGVCVNIEKTLRKRGVSFKPTNI